MFFFGLPPSWAISMQAYSSALDFDGRARGLRGEVLKRSWLAEERHHRGG